MKTQTKKNPEEKLLAKAELLLRRRTDAAHALISACSEINKFCEENGIEHIIYDEDACLGMDIRIWCEVGGSEDVTFRAIQAAIKEKGVN